MPPSTMPRWSSAATIAWTRCWPSIRAPTRKPWRWWNASQLGRGLKTAFSPGTATPATWTTSSPTVSMGTSYHRCRPIHFLYKTPPLTRHDNTGFAVVFNGANGCVIVGECRQRAAQRNGHVAFSAFKIDGVDAGATVGLLNSAAQCAIVIIAACTRQTPYVVISINDEERSRGCL